MFPSPSVLFDLYEFLFNLNSFGFPIISPEQLSLGIRCRSQAFLALLGLRPRAQEKDSLISFPKQYQYDSIFTRACGLPFELVQSNVKMPAVGLPSLGKLVSYLGLKGAERGQRM